MISVAFIYVRRIIQMCIKVRNVFSHSISDHKTTLLKLYLLISKIKVRITATGGNNRSKD